MSVNERLSVMRNHPLIISLISVLLFATAGELPAKWQSWSSEGTLDAMNANIPAEDEAYFRMNPDQRKAFCNKALQIKIGETRENVVTLLGKPWSDDPLVKKEKPIFIARYVTYYVTKWRQQGVNERLDASVVFVFGPDDRLRKINSNTPEIPSRDEVREQTPPPKARAPYFEKSAEERAQFIDKMQRIDIGATRKAVEAVLGKSCSDHILAPKNRPQRPFGRAVTYYVVLYEKDVANDRLNQLVTLRFDMNDHLVSIWSNVSGIPNRPDPSR